MLTDFLGEYQGALQSDGYGAYNIYENTKGVTLLVVGHTHGVSFSRHEMNTQSLITLEMIAQLYGVEREADQKGLSADERMKLREQRAFPLFESCRIG